MAYSVILNFFDLFVVFILWVTKPEKRIGFDETAVLRNRNRSFWVEPEPATPHPLRYSNKMAIGQLLKIEIKPTFFIFTSVI